MVPVPLSVNLVFMILFQTEDGVIIGFLTWHSVHPPIPSRKACQTDEGYTTAVTENSHVNFLNLSCDKSLKVLTAICYFVSKCQ